MKKVLILMAVLAIIALAVPATAMPTSIDPTHSYWSYQWFTGFDYDVLTPAGPLANPNYTNPGNSPPTAFDSTGNDGWVSPKFTAHATLVVTNNSGNVVADPLALSAGRVYKPGPSASIVAGNANYRNSRTLNSRNYAYDEGFVEYWMYDPRGTGTLVETNSNVMVASPQYDPASVTTSSSYTWGASLGDARVNGKTNWIFQHTGTFIDATGTGATTAGGTGGGLVFTRVLGQARVRSMGWHQIQLYWNYTYTTARFEMYVDNMITPCVTADMTSINSRWPNLNDGVAGLWMGGTQYATTKAPLIDEVSFYGRIDPNHPFRPLEPEPSGLMALGAGMIGLLGLIRRRK